MVHLHVMNNICIALIGRDAENESCMHDSRVESDGSTGDAFDDNAMPT